MTANEIRTKTGSATTNWIGAEPRSQ